MAANRWKFLLTVHLFFVAVHENIITCNSPLSSLPQAMEVENTFLFVKKIYLYEGAAGITG